MFVFAHRFFTPPPVGKHWWLTPKQMSSPTVRDINIAVVGSAGVGKTTFIERAYDLSVTPSHGEVHSLTVMVDRSPCSVGLVEVDLNRINFNKQPMQWPRVSCPFFVFRFPFFFFPPQQ